MEKLRELIRQAIAKVLDEDNVTSGGEAYLTKFAFSKGGKNRATKTAEKLGMKVVNEVSYRSFNKTISEVTPERKISKAILGIKKRLREVNQIVDFEPGMSINENQIRLDGSLPDQDINFVLIAGQEAGVYINAEMLKLETEVGNLMEKLVKFQATFETSMNPLIQLRNNN